MVEHWEEHQHEDGKAPAYASDDLNRDPPTSFESVPSSSSDDGSEMA